MHLPIHPVPSQTPSAAPTATVRGQAVFTLLFAGLAGIGWFSGRADSSGLASAFLALGAWAVGAALAAAMGVSWRRAVVEWATLAGVSWLLWNGWRNLPVAAPVGESLRLIAVLLLVLGVILRFAALHAESLQRLEGRAAPLAPLARFLFLYCLAAAGALFLRLSAGFDATGAVALAGLVSVVLFLGGALARAALRFYQPLALRDTDPLLTGGLLAVLLRGGHPLRALAASLERQLGVRLGEIWALQFVRSRLPVVAATTTVLVVGASCFTVVPTTAHGVRVRLGHFIEPALGPGLHVGWPWPLEQIAIVPTGAVQEISLGFERDIGGAILWAEKHFEGERNLLVGTGEELLTVNVPIYFRIADPVAWLRHTADAQTALTHLAERHLLALTAAHESFRLMTTERVATANQLRARLQSDAAALRLGVEIVFVGLKDVHPPVAVAAAYQDVVSAEEDKEAHIYLGRQYAADQLPRAHEEATRLLTAARAAAAAKLAAATGEAARFASLEAAHRAAPQLFRQRLKLETLAEILPRPEKIVIDRHLAAGQAMTLDLRSRDGGNFLDAAITAPPSSTDATSLDAFIQNPHPVPSAPSPP